jgi:hypothetical protein
LQQPEYEQSPKVLLQFGGQSLLERHLMLLRDVGVEKEFRSLKVPAFYGGCSTARFHVDGRRALFNEDR